MTEPAHPSDNAPSPPEALFALRPSAHVIRANALDLPLADSSVDLIVTSPPYFGLRSYQDGGEHYAGQIGSEATPAEFVDALIAATREMVRVLKPSGSIFVNLGDKYAGSQPSASRWHTAKLDGGRGRLPELAESQSTVADNDWGGIRAKSLIGIPWRYALRCIDDLGLILRAEIIWSKPNGLPESVTDRVRRSHEQWFHLTTQGRYFSAVDEIRMQYLGQQGGTVVTAYGAGNHGTGGSTLRQLDTNPLGKLPGSVWSIPTQPLRVPPHLGIDHFAAFPMEWPRRIIQGWSPAGICTGCGEGRRPVADVRLASFDRGNVGSRGSRYTETHDQHQHNRMGQERVYGRSEATITGYACGCPEPTAPTRPSVVLDPFGGTGTTLLVAKALGRNAIGTDLSADYCRLATWRCTDPGQLADALQIEKPDIIPDDQLSLFDGEFDTAIPSRPSGGLAYSRARGQDCGACGYRMQYAGRVTCEKCGAPRRERAS